MPRLAGQIDLSKNEAILDAAVAVLVEPFARQPAPSPALPWKMPWRLLVGTINVLCSAPNKSTAASHARSTPAPRTARSLADSLISRTRTRICKRAQRRPH